MERLHVPVTAAQRRFAAAWARAHDASPMTSDRAIPHAVGAFRLRSDQTIAVRRILDAFDEFGGALLADPPGTGKTVVALAVVRALGAAASAIVVAPASLRAQWDRTAARAGVAIHFRSMEAMSRTAGLDRPDGAIVIIDEAHHARTPLTRRHRRLSTLCAGARVLLLSATPVVNRIAERDAMLALFLPADARERGGGALERCVVRRERASRRMPRIHRRPALPLPRRACHERIASRLAALPPPLPTADGRAALALVRITLAMAWASSLAALDAALRRRIQRGGALADLLAAGATPTRAALREWIVGDDATQLAFPTLVASTAPSDADVVAQQRVLQRHLEAVRALRAIVHAAVDVDTRDRAALILALSNEAPTERLVVFSRHAWTIRALWSALRQEPGVVAVVGERTYAAHGRWGRNEILSALGPRAKPLRRDDPRAIRLLLTTDLLAEGVELQGASRVLHADRAWTPATMEQREGRVARGTRRDVLVARIAAPREAVPFLRLGARLLTKDRARHRAMRQARCLEDADATFRRWLSDVRVHRRRTGTGAADHARRGFVAALRAVDVGTQREHLLFVAGDRRGDAWRITSSSCAIARVVRGKVTAPSAVDLVAIRRALARWVRLRSTRALVGGDAASPARLTRRWRRLQQRVDASIRATPHAARAGLAQALERALGAIRTASAASSQRTVVELLALPRLTPDTAFQQALVVRAEQVRKPATSALTLGRPSLLALVCFR